MSSKSSSLPLILRLPPELGLRIYRLLLLSDQTVRMTWRQDDESCPRPNCLSRAILRTCRHIHNEAIDVLYRDNNFRAHRINDANIPAVSIRRAKFVVSISHVLDGDSFLQSFLDHHPNIEFLVLEYALGLLEDSKLRDRIRQMLFRYRCSPKLVVKEVATVRRIWKVGQKPQHGSGRNSWKIQDNQ